MTGKNATFVDYSPPPADATWLNIIQTEQNNVIESAGQTLSDGQLDQQAISIASYAAQGGVFGTDSGSANAYVITQVSPFKAPFSFKNGLTIRFRAGNANTGASTINPFGLGVKNIKQSDGSTDLVSGMITTSTDVVVRYNSSLGVFILSGTASQYNIGTSGSTVMLNSSIAGMIAPFPANIAPAGWLEADGSLVSRATYPDLWAFAQASGNIVADGSWTAGKFSTGDGSTTFRIPDLRGYFIRSWAHDGSIDSGRAIGSTQLDAFQGHAHTISYQWESKTNDTGAGQRVNNNNLGSTTNNTTWCSNANIERDSQGTPRTAAETRPINIAFIYCIKF